MKKMTNKVIIQGRLFQHDLKVKQVQNTESANYGKDYIAGSMSIATDDAGLNVVTVNYTYVTPTTAKGDVNKTYVALKTIIESNKAWVDVGPEQALKVKADTNFGVNDFVSSRDNSMVSATIHDGGFVTIITNLNEDEKSRTKFEADFLIHQLTRVEPDEEKGIKEEYADVKGHVFNFRGNLVPVTCRIRNVAGIDWFEGLNVTKSSPCLLKVWGRVVSRTIKEERKETSAWGEESVTYFEKTNKEWLITGNSEEPYAFGDEAILTEDELRTALQAREVSLAETRKRHEDRATTTATATTATAPAAPVASKKAFDF